MCPINWIVYSSHCYYVNTYSTDWYSARSWCQTQGGDLVIIRNQLEFNLVQGFYNNYNISRLYVNILIII